jgi:hypothetical protein
VVKGEVAGRVSGRGRFLPPYTPTVGDDLYPCRYGRHGCGEPIPFTHEPGVPGLPFFSDLQTRSRFAGPGNDSTWAVRMGHDSPDETQEP